MTNQESNESLKTWPNASRRESIRHDIRVDDRIRYLPEKYATVARLFQQSRCAVEFP